MTYRWLSRETVKEICAIQQGGEHGIGAAMYECIGAYRLFDVVELALQGRMDDARAVFAKCDTSKWGAVETIMKCMHVRERHGSNEAFTPTCLAAHQQLADVRKLLAGDATGEQMARIKTRHEAYRIAQTIGPFDDA